VVEALAVQLVEDNAALRIDQGLIGDPEFLEVLLASLLLVRVKDLFVAAAKGNKRERDRDKGRRGMGARVSAHVRACERSADGRDGCENDRDLRGSFP